MRVRKALAYGIDRKSIINEIYLNNAEAVDVPIPPIHGCMMEAIGYMIAM